MIRFCGELTKDFNCVIVLGAKMRIPKPPFSFYRDCRVFGNSYSIFNCFGLGAYTTNIRYSRWLNVGMSYSFARLNTESLK
jgi:hypothetical protein